MLDFSSPPPGQGFWTAERDRLLIHLMETGCSTAEAARQLGASRNAVIGRVHRLEQKTGKRMARRQPSSTVKRARMVTLDGQPRVKRRYIRTAPIVPRPSGAGQTVPRPVTLATAAASILTLEIASPFKAEAPAAAPAPTGKPVPLLKLRANGCRYAVDEDSRGRHLFCNADRITGKSYCAHHQPLTVAEYGPKLVRETMRSVRSMR